MDMQQTPSQEETQWLKEQFEKEPRLRPKPEELKKAIAAMIQEVEDYFLVHSFTAAGCGSFEDPMIDIDRFAHDEKDMTPIDPQIAAEDNRFEACLGIVSEAIAKGGMEANYALDRLDSLRHTLTSAFGKVGYYIGIFMGARLMGASHDDLEKLGKGLFRTLA